MEIITRKEAKERGLKRYFTGKPCKHGHISEKTFPSGNCVECLVFHEKQKYERHKEKIKQRVSRWSKRNPDKVKSYVQKRRERNLNSAPPKKKRCSSCGDTKMPREFYRHIASVDGLYHECKSCHKVRFRKLLESNPMFYAEKYQKGKENIKARSKEYKRRHPEKVKAYMAGWRIENKERMVAYQQNRRSAIEKAGGTHTAEDIKALLKRQAYKCAACHKCVKDGYHVDHIQPLAKGGTNWPENLQILCPFCNLSKGAKDPYEWANELGRLL